jgi:hypothetical protein
MIELSCIVCRHNKKAHLPKGGKRNIIILPQGEHWCEECVKHGHRNFESFHTFKLDNLQFVEDLAKERKLI